jgi:hypothetical protein
MIECVIMTYIYECVVMIECVIMTYIHECVVMTFIAMRIL